MTGIGDSAHATRPDLGQGGAMALEVRPHLHDTASMRSCIRGDASTMRQSSRACHDLMCATPAILHSAVAVGQAKPVLHPIQAHVSCPGACKGP